jgi:hypothetical protein
MAYWFLRTRFRGKGVDHSEYDHWQGGKPRHKDAKCPSCARPFLLLWDLNCRDPRFLRARRPAFQHLDRLPFYYCWRCGSDVFYQVRNAKSVEVFPAEEGPEHSPPYSSYPRSFDRRPLELAPLTSAPPAFERLAGKSIFDAVPRQLKSSIENWLGHPVTLFFDVHWHEFGGEPFEWQGPETVQCPNQNCARVGRPMKILASICDDPVGGLPMVCREGPFNRGVQVVYHICPNCFTVRAANRCD